MVLLTLLGAIGAAQPSFLSLDNLGVLAAESSVILLLATAQTVVILLGGIDLSMASLAALASVLLALTSRTRATTLRRRHACRAWHVVGHRANNRAHNHPG